MRARQIASWLICIAAFAFFIALPFLRPQFPVTQGDFVGQLAEKRGTVTIRADQQWLIQLEDGRSFWIDVAPSKAALNGTPVKIEIKCQTDAFKRCSARYIAH